MKLARHNALLFHKSPDKPTREEEKFLRQLGKVIGTKLCWSVPIPKLPEDLYNQRYVAPYIGDRRKLIDAMFNAGTLTPQSLLRNIEHFRPIKEDDEQKQVWCSYTYVDAN